MSQAAPPTTMTSAAAMIATKGILLDLRGGLGREEMYVAALTRCKGRAVYMGSAVIPHRDVNHSQLLVPQAEEEDKREVR